MTHQEYQSGDTIVALSTPPGYSGIGVIRMSGPEALSILKRSFRSSAGSAELDDRRGHYGSIIDPDSGKVLDDGIVLCMKAPASYTGEDVAELNLHGSPVVLDEVTHLLVRLGARPATRGEFTRRAFLAGKLDLVQAEAVIDFIESASPSAAAEARGRLDASVSHQVREVSHALKDIISEIEAHIDFDEDDEEEPPEAEHLIRTVCDKMRTLHRLGDVGRVRRDGVRTVIIGKPNVGKSTLFNALLRSDRAIVTPLAGTTRDSVEERLVIGGVTVSLCDTAGIRKNPDPIEQEGIRRTLERTVRADLVLAVVDGSAQLDDEDAAVVAHCRDKKAAVILNKADRTRVVRGSDPVLGPRNHPRLVLSAVTGDGLQELRDLLARYGREVTSPASGASEGGLNRRCLHLVEAAMAPLTELLASLDKGRVVPPEIVSLALRRSLHPMEEITGERVDEGILDRIFERFCVGK